MNRWIGGAGSCLRARWKEKQTGHWLESMSRLGKNFLHGTHVSLNYHPDNPWAALMSARISCQNARDWTKYLWQIPGLYSLVSSAVPSPSWCLGLFRNTIYVLCMQLFACTCIQQISSSLFPVFYDLAKILVAYRLFWLPFCGFSLEELSKSLIPRLQCHM